MNKNKKILIVGLILLVIILQIKEPKKMVGESSLRSFESSQIYANQETTVSIAVNPGTSTYLLIDEVIPTGWTVISASDSGDYTTNPGHVFWTVLTGATIKTYTYTVNPGADLGIKSFTGTIGFELLGESSIGGENSIEVIVASCTTDAECPAAIDCKSWSCSAGTCVSANINEGGSCTGGTCQSGVCVPTTCTPDWTCTDFSPALCPSSCSQTRVCTDTNSCGVDTGKPAETQSCSGGDCNGVTCDCNTWIPLECGTGTNEGKRRFTRTCTPSACDTEEQYVTDSACAVESCEEKLDCEVYQTCNEDETECKLAGWVWLVVGFMAFIMIFKLM